MKHIRISPVSLLRHRANDASRAGTVALRGRAPPLNLDLPPAPSPNRFGLNYRMGLNAPVSFKNFGGLSGVK